MSRQNNSTMLKIRIIPLRRMRMTEAVAKLRHAMRTGYMAADIEVAYIDWESGKGRRVTSGTIAGSDMTALVNFFEMMESSQVRAERAES